jgi:hypothetical protein
VTWVMWNLISVRLQIVLCQCKIGARFAPNVLLAQKLFWMNTIVFLGDVAQVEARFSPFRDSANLSAR